MSIKRMVTKLALAYAATKGAEAFRNMGGISGLKDALQGPTGPGEARGGMQGRIGGDRASGAGGLGNILASLGQGAATDGREAGTGGQISPQNASLGSLFGMLAGALGQQVEPRAAARDLDRQFEVNDAEADSDARPILRAMVHMARVDGQIDETEQSALFDILDDASDDERAMLKSAMREPVDAQSIAAETPRHARKEVYSAALLISAPDNSDEMAFLRDLAAHLGLGQGELDDLHRAMGKPVIAMS